MDHLLYQLSFVSFQSCIIAGISIILLLLRHYRSGLITILIGGAWLYLCATPGFVTIMRHGLESQYAAQPAATYPVVDAIVILGGQPVPSAKLNWQERPIKLGQNRLGFGYQLYRQGRAPIIVLSSDRTGAASMAASLETHGIPATSLRIDSRANTTYENAFYTSRLLRQDHLQRVLLVTSPYHMPRALAAFRKQGIDTIPAPTQPISPISTVESQWLPRRRSQYLAQRYLHEYVGFLTYWLRGRV